MMTPEEQVAALFMAHKGYPGIEPYDIDEIVPAPGKDVSCWYFLYELPEGILELEVFWDEERMEWETTVSTFTSAEGRA